MPSDLDDLILKMQHLEAAARAAGKARALAADTGRLRTQLQRLAAEAQAELSVAERDQADAAEKVARARTPGLAPLEAADLLGDGRALLADARVRAVKARARLTFSLEKMDEVERREWEALQAEARSEAHAQLAESGDDASGPAGGSKEPSPKPGTGGEGG